MPQVLANLCHQHIQSINLLKEGENLIAAEVHQDNITSSDIGFSLSLEGTENNIENYLSNLIKDGLDNNL